MVKVAALQSEIARASNQLKSVSGLLANYHTHYSHPLNILPEAAAFLNAEKLTGLVDDLLSTIGELDRVQSTLRQAGID
jgi:hypothetical protein